jgi:hypothetical protein
MRFIKYFHDFNTISLHAKYKRENIYCPGAMLFLLDFSPVYLVLAQKYNQSKAKKSSFQVL